MFQIFILFGISIVLDRSGIHCNGCAALLFRTGLDLSSGRMGSSLVFATVGAVFRRIHFAFLSMPVCVTVYTSPRAETLVDGSPPAVKFICILPAFATLNSRMWLWIVIWLVEMVTLQAILFSSRRQIKPNGRAENLYAPRWLVKIFAGSCRRNVMNVHQTTHLITADRIVYTRGYG